MRRPVRGDNLQSFVFRKPNNYGRFLSFTPCQLAAIGVNVTRTCANGGTKLTQACSSPVHVGRACA